jgi:hypothetical protein
MLATMRSSIDYSLSKRRTLIALFQGAASAMDACDADPYLRRAAKYHGELTKRSCPVCKKLKIVELRYAFGDQSEYGEFRVYVVEICTDCHWNHLVESFLLGDGKYRKPPRKVRTLADED